MSYYADTDIDALTELETLERQAGQLVRKRSAVQRPDQRAVIQKDLETIQLRIRQLRSQLRG